MHALTSQLLQAIETGSRLTMADLLPLADEAEARRVQAELVLALGGAGAWKVSPWSEGATMTGAPIPSVWIHSSGQTLQRPGAVEVELALIWQAKGHYLVAPAIELIGSRLAPADDWDAKIKQADLLATAGLLIGRARPLPDVSEIRCDVILNDGIDTVTTTAIISMTALKKAAEWIENYAEHLGLGFCEGQIIMTGARLGPQQISGTHIHAELVGLGAVEMRTA